MKQYEGLFILDTEDSATGVDGLIEGVGTLISEAGGEIIIGPLSGGEGKALKAFAKSSPAITFLNG